jgi:nitrite reductase/ring-hydroxylating ferredoxin subunit
MLSVCTVDDIPEDEARGFRIGETSLFVVRRDDALHVYRNSCPHLGIELNWIPDQFLDREGSLIQCSTHGALFRIEDGECLAGPCHGAALEVIPHRIVDGQLLVALDDTTQK